MKHKLLSTTLLLIGALFILSGCSHSANKIVKTNTKTKQFSSPKKHNKKKTDKITRILNKPTLINNSNLELFTVTNPRIKSGEISGEIKNTKSNNRINNKSKQPKKIRLFSNTRFNLKKTLLGIFKAIQIFISNRITFEAIHNNLF